MTPADSMEDLDGAVQAFARDALEHPGLVTGWVVMIASTNYDEEGDTTHSFDYGSGPSTDLIRALGLVEACRTALHRDIVSGDTDG